MIIINSYVNLADLVPLFRPHFSVSTPEVLVLEICGTKEGFSAS
jgi:hypothetical protein